jgi:hypothetical protein
MNQLIKLTKQDIIDRYKDKPIFIETKEEKAWYIVVDINDYMPLHMLTKDETKMYRKDYENISAINVVGADCECGYLMWCYFNTENGWKAYGYE